MGLSYRQVLTILLFFAIFLASSQLGATRSMREQFQSLRGIVPPSGPNPCTYVPKPSSGRCT
ncbi:hypothetical protein FH972_002390 [Carpinus fangiana]|uniref:Transmembrane protein n=1 Tax=Carpinus fangiana TaxID=176857 RepID=A0A5N6QEQ5_9ROSI|nr:hypothetical protein FH972_002390 [Carpinus fangiana]